MVTRLLLVAYCAVPLFLMRISLKSSVPRKRQRGENCGSEERKPIPPAKRRSKDMLEISARKYEKREVFHSKNNPKRVSKVAEPTQKSIKEATSVTKVEQKTAAGPSVQSDTTEYHELNPVMSRILEKELQDIMIKVWRCLPDDSDDPNEKIVIEKFKNKAGDQLCNAIGLNVTKRLLNVHNPLYVKIVFSEKPWPEELKKFITKYNIVSIRGVSGLGTAYAAKVNTIQDFDALCTNKNLTVGKNIKVTVTPCYQFLKCPSNLKTIYDMNVSNLQSKAKTSKPKEMPKNPDIINASGSKVNNVENITKTDSQTKSNQTNFKPTETQAVSKPAEKNINAPPKVAQQQNNTSLATPSKPANKNITPTAKQAATASAKTNITLDKEVPKKTPIKSNQTLTVTTSNTSQVAAQKQNVNANKILNQNQTASKAEKTPSTPPSVTKQTPNKTNQVAAQKQNINTNKILNQNQTTQKVEETPSTPVTKQTLKTSQVAAQKQNVNANKSANQIQAQKVNETPSTPATKETVKETPSTPATKKTPNKTSQCAAENSAQKGKKSPNVPTTKVTPNKTNQVATQNVNTNKNVNQNQSAQKAKTTSTVAATSSNQNVTPKVTAPKATNPTTPVPAKSVAKKTQGSVLGKPAANVKVATQTKKVPAKVAENKKIVETKRKPQKISPKKKHESDFDELDDHDILALLSSGIVVDECSGSED